MKLLGIDIETTGLSPDKDSIIEVGAVLWDSERNKPLIIMNEFVQAGVPIPPFITDLTGITQSDLDAYGKSKEAVIAMLKPLIDQADYIVGHNIKDFDAPFMAKNFGINLPNILDTRVDIKFPKGTKSKALNVLLGEHEILNYFPHRAFSDALCTLKLLSKYDLTKVISRSTAKTLTIQAVVSYADKDLAKERGFHWKGDRKQWLIDLKEDEYNPEEYNFKTKVLAKAA